MTEPAIRTVSETDDTRTIEGRIAYGGPFGGRDSYGTIFTARTDWALGMHPAGLPVLYNHGFDPDFGMDPIGFTEPTASFRSEVDGLWVKMQLDKRHRYYEERVKPLLDAGGVGVSQGSAEHSLKIDARTGEVQAWPMHEVSITPTESNPWNLVAARTAEIISIVDAIRATNKAGEAVGKPEGGKAREDIPAEDFAGPDKSYPIVDQGSVDSAAKLIDKAANPDAVKAKVITIAKRKGLQIPEAWRSDEAVRSASMDAGMAAGILQSLFYLRDCEMGEDDQVSILNEAVDAIQRFITAEAAEPEPDMELGEMTAYMSAVRAGKRNSAADIKTIQQAIDLLGSVIAEEKTEDESTSEPAEDAARTGEALPTITIVERDDPEAIRAELLALATRTGTEVAARLTG